ncbi:MAG: adenosine kinase [Ignavibacteriae bacterium]|nr:adenosine kinase [Ignavibacteriota bacterium]
MTKDIHLCGLGNALVDIEFQLSDSEFDSLNLQRGTMTLVDSLDQNILIKQMEHHTPHRSSGGSAANTIIAFGQFGGKAGYKAVLGDDDMGRFYASEFTDLGIHLDAELVPDTHTGKCLVLITPDAERTMLTALGVNGNFGVEHIVESTIARSEWLYVEGYKFTESSGRAAIMESIMLAKKYGTKIAVSFSDTFIVNFFREGLEEALTYADLIFCNLTEGAAYTGLEDSDEVFGVLTKQFANVCLTMGKSGSRVHWNGTAFEIPSYPTTPIDTTGAGDMYAAGFLYGITHGYSPDVAGRLGSLAASKIVSQFGARLKESPEAIRDEILLNV